MADGRIVINTEINKGNVNQELRALQNELKGMQNEMKLANAQAMLPFQKNMLEVEKSMFGLAKSMGSYRGTNQQFIGDVQQLGLEYKKASDAMINADKSIATSMIQTAGQMMNMSTQASKISDNYTRMQNPMLNVNQAGLAVADTMNKIANNGNAAVLSLKMLGPNASMKQLYDMQNMINQGLMRFNMVALAAAATSVILYGALHGAAMENAAYAESFNTMLATLRQAFQPMVDVFTSVMTKVYDFITAIGQMIIKFNEAHPTLAKIIQGIMMLVPALTLLLSPLAVGIGLWAGMQAAFASIWALIGPLVTGLAAMSATVWIVSAAIVGLVAGIVYLWNTHEGFRNAIITAWQTIVAVLTPVIETIKQSFITAFNMMKESLAPLGEAFMNLWASLQPLMPLLQGIAAVVAGVFVVAWTNTISTIAAVAAAIGPLVSAFMDLISMIINVVSAVISLLLGDFDGAMKSWNAATENSISFFKNLWDGIVAFIETFVSTFSSIIKGMAEAVGIDIKGMATKAKDEINNMVQQCTTYFNNLKTNAVNAFNELKTNAVNRANELATQAINKFNELKTNASNAVENMKTAVLNAFAALGRSVAQSMSEVVSAVKDKWKQAESFLKGIDLSSIGKNIIQGLLNGINSMADSVVNKAREIANSIKDTIAGALQINSPSKWMRDVIGGSLVEGFEMGVDRNKRGYISSAEDLTSFMMPKVPDLSSFVSSSLAPSLAGVGSIDKSISNSNSYGDVHFTINPSNMKEWNMVTDFFSDLRQAKRSF